MDTNGEKKSNELAKSPERIFVSVLAFDVVGSTQHIAKLDPDDAQEFLDECYLYLKTVIEQAGGFLANYNGDGGIAVFGWPQSMENHADQACVAAWNIQARSEKYIRGPDNKGVRFRVGVHSGLVGMRRFRLEGGSKLDTVGGTVHISAALEKDAPQGGILISSITRALCRATLDVERVKPLPVLEAIEATAFRILSEPKPSKNEVAVKSVSGKIFGRKDEQKKIHGALTNIREYAYGGLALIGEPGIGKSRLAVAAIDSAEKLGIQTFMVYASAQERTTAFATIRSLLRIMTRQSESEFPSEKSPRLEGLDQRSRYIVERVLSDIEANGLGVDQYTDRQIMSALVEACVSLIGGNPTLIVVEEFHLIDEESRQCLFDLTDTAREKSVLILLTSRPERLEALSRKSVEPLYLNRLSGESIKAMATELSRDSILNKGALDTIVQRAEGSPFVLEQIIRNLDITDHDALHRLPYGVESLIHARINRLPDHTKVIVQGLSILGEGVSEDVAMRILGEPLVEFQRSLHQLTEEAFLKQVRDGIIRFNHAMIAEACETTVPRKVKRQLHQDAIIAIEEEARNLDQQYERLAFHAEGAGKIEGALAYLWRAALVARRSSASGSLLLLFERALGYIEEIGATADEQYIDFVLLLCTPLLHRGELALMNDHLPKAIELAQRIDRQDKACNVMCQLGSLYWFNGNYREGVPLMRDAHDKSLALGSLPLRIASQIMHALMLYAVAEFDRALDLISELSEILDGDLAQAQLGGAAVPSVMVRSFRGWFLLEVAEYSAGLDYANEALEMARAYSDPYGEVFALNSSGVLNIAFGNLEKAEDCMMQALHIAKKNSYDTIHPHLIGHLASILSRLGRPEQAVELAEEWLASPLRNRTGKLELFYFQAGYGEALVSAGDDGAGRIMIDRAVDQARDMESPTLLMQGLSVRSRCSALSETREIDIVARDKEDMTQLTARYGIHPWM